MKAIEEGARTLSIIPTGVVIWWMGTVRTKRLATLTYFHSWTGPGVERGTKGRGQSRGEGANKRNAETRNPFSFPCLQSKKLLRLHGLVAPTKGESGWPGPSPLLPQNRDLSTPAPRYIPNSKHTYSLSPHPAYIVKNKLRRNYALT